MNRNATLIVVFVFIALCIAWFVYYKNNYFPKYTWYPQYNKTSDQPYGLKLFYNSLKSLDENTTSIYNQDYTLLDTNLTNSNFISVGNSFYVDSVYAGLLLKYIEKGNRVLISSNYSPLELLRNFVPIGDTISGFRFLPERIIELNYIKEIVPYPGNLNFHYQFLKDTTTINWNFYKKSYFRDTLLNYSFIPISFLNDSNLSSFYIQHGKGRLIVNSTPVLLTNYYMIKQSGFRHTNNLLSQLNKGPIYWDDPGNQQQNNSGSHPNNPLKFLFSHSHLKWGWYLFLFTILLYLVFRSKREQRIIPLMPVNTNASIEFTKAIGTLYFQNKGHNRIANEMYFVFLSEVRSRYNISTDIPETELIEQLSQRSGAGKSLLLDLFRQFRYIKIDEEASEDDLINLYNTIENYNKKRK